MIPMTRENGSFFLLWRL